MPSQQAPKSGGWSPPPLPHPLDPPLITIQNHRFILSCSYEIDFCMCASVKHYQLCLHFNLATQGHCPYFSPGVHCHQVWRNHKSYFNSPTVQPSPPQKLMTANEAVEGESLPYIVQSHFLSNLRHYKHCTWGPRTHGPKDWGSQGPRTQAPKDPRTQSLDGCVALHLLWQKHNYRQPVPHTYNTADARAQHGPATFKNFCATQPSRFWVLGSLDLGPQLSGPLVLGSSVHCVPLNLHSAL